jgi:hypothetical protein
MNVLSLPRRRARKTGYCETDHFSHFRHAERSEGRLSGDAGYGHGLYCLPAGCHRKIDWNTQKHFGFDLGDHAT